MPAAPDPRGRAGGARADRFLHGGLALLWLLAPVWAGEALAAGLDGSGAAVRWTAGAGLWSAWTVALLALLVPRTVSLTVARTVVPAALPAVAWGAAAGDVGTGVAVAGLAPAALAAVAVLAPQVGGRFAQGSAYGDEERFLLRAPTPALALVPFAWAAVVAGAAAGPLVLATGAVPAGAATAAVGLPAAVVAARALHGLSRRWVVFVPAGVVLHDPYGLADPVLIPRSRVARLGPARPGDDRLELAPATAGLVLAVTTREPAELVPAGRGRGPAPAPIATAEVAFVPTQPGRVLAAAARRRFPVS